MQQPSQPAIGVPASSRLQAWSLAFGFWTLLGLSYAISQQLSSASEGAPIGWPHALTRHLLNSYLWMLFTPLVQSTARWTFNGSWRRFLAAHIPAAVLIAALHTLVFLSLYWPLRGADQNIHSIGTLFQLDFVFEFHLGLLTYGVMLAVLKGIQTQRKLQGEQLRSSQLQAQLAQSQLQALRMQLQPHFLFNTLNAISALTLDNPLLARSMIARLADFLRLTLEERGSQNVPLSRELQFVESYLAIQQLRFQDRLGVELEIPTSVLNASVPHLILQPIIENALLHGLAPKAGAGTLHVRAQRAGADLQLRIDDDGLGLPPGELAENVGLGNIRARLQARYGEHAQLRLAARPGGGTRVELSLPFAEHVA